MADEVPVAEDTSFAVASISKPFALVSALRAQESELLNLDDSIRELLPDFPIEHLTAPEAAITTRMLLTHTAGIRDDFLRLARVSYEGPPVLDLEAFSRAYFLPGGDLYDAGYFRQAPGTARNYCNACYGLLGYVVEVASDLPEGEDFRALNRRDVIEPLGLGDTHWFYTDVEPGKIAIPYSYSRRRFNANPSITQANYPAGSLYSSIRDLVRFAQMWLGQGTVDDVTVLSEASVEETLMTPFPAADSRQRLAFAVRRHGEVDYISQSGATIGGAAQFLLLPEEDGAIIVLTNSDAYIRSRFGQPEGAEAIEEIVLRLAEL